MINIRKFAAVSMARSGTRFILAQYMIGMVLPLSLGVSSIRVGLSGIVREIALGGWLVSIAANYIPLFIYAALIARGGTVREEAQPEFAYPKRYGVLQEGIVLVPFLVVILALMQESINRER